MGGDAHRDCGDGPASPRADDPAVLSVLQQVFGHASWRSRQREAIDAVLAGRDVVLTLPTGQGKSLCYQLPALILEGLTLVVSPLIALMQDQVQALRERGVRASFVNSTLSSSERASRLADAARGAFDLLYVTPERFRSEAFLEILPDLDVTRLAVDEAHCISSWGHDFRPDYTRLGEYRKLLGDPPTIALTATATTRVVEEICTFLRLDDPRIERAGIERPNLFLAVHEVADREERLDLLATRIREIGGAGIVYTALIRELEDLHGELARRGVETLVYHGKLSAHERKDMQQRFMASENDVVLATNAFGMGIDKADIRFILHLQIPRTLEAWTQEVGRAGRDGAPSWCELFYLEEDLAVQQTFVEWANPSREYLTLVYETLESWGERVQTKDLGDLRAELLVKNRHDNRVGICLRWLEVLGVIRGNFEDHDLRVVRPLRDRDLPETVGSVGKRDHDLRNLLSMLSFAKEHTRCRRVLLAEHFELETPLAPCGGCDVCTDAAVWRSEHLTKREQTALEPAARSGSFARGDWVEVDRRFRGQVLRVEGRGRSLRLVVEDAKDLERRTVDPNRRRVRRIREGDG